PRESGRPTIFDPCQYGDRVEVIGAGHNAAGRTIWEDQRVRMTVLIVDDHGGFRESARALLEAGGGAGGGCGAAGAVALGGGRGRGGGWSGGWCCWICSFRMGPGSGSRSNWGRPRARRGWC